MPSDITRAFCIYYVSLTSANRNITNCSAAGGTWAILIIYDCIFWSTEKRERQTIVMIWHRSALRAICKQP
ncbi:hypothetical protein K503DRAFT_772606 [Rhizopogon vinicolor AM-OR11-026]|uniref:Uncharacterized protein n=1 Tax=Rhizopogon vinicolor AM-OR11-026 TaxID=1314800 RepID=A0A1B7MUY7_9AGAM|nr:hypothetical protein K503DRAFT_772606 [Rhizopogon vinicolor AM-OR11-026]